jgi:protoheme ferro-lyase
MSVARRHHQHRRLPQQLGGSVVVSHVRDRTGEGQEAFAISWHSNGGDLEWLSPTIASEEAAEIAAAVLSSFIGATKAKR